MSRPSGSPDPDSKSLDSQASNLDSQASNPDSQSPNLSLQPKIYDLERLRSSAKSPPRSVLPPNLHPVSLFALHASRHIRYSFFSLPDMMPYNINMNNCSQV
jgi:hypothetical protein